MLVGGAAAVLVISLVVFGVRKFMRNGESGNPSAVSESQSTEAITVESTELKKAVTINDIDITGMDRAQARKAVLDKFSWSMKAELEAPSEGDESFEIMDLMTIRLDKILAEIYDSGRTPAEAYIINADSLDEEISMEAAAMAAKWDRKPKNGAVTSYDKENKQFTYSESVDGRTVDQEKLAEDIRTAMKEQDYDRVIKVKADVTPGEDATVSYDGYAGPDMRFVNTTSSSIAIPQKPLPIQTATTT